MGRIRTRSTRRLLLVLVALGAVLELAVGAVVLAGEDSPQRLRTATPLHPVAGTFRPDGRTIEQCEGQGCYEQAFGNVAYREGPRRALALLEKTYTDLGDPSCHRVAHSIGAASLARNRGDVAKTFAQGSSSCFSGYYHGVLERSLAGVGPRSAGALAGVARGLCGGRALERSLWLRFQCLHGLGHGLMISTGYALPLSLEVCDRLATPWEERSCNGGAFMENIATSYGVASRYLRDDDPVYPCTAVAEEDKLKCYELVTARIVRALDGDWGKTAAACTEVEPDWVPACFRSFGRDVAGQAHYQAEGVLELCELAREHGHERECLTAAAKAMVGNYRSGVQAAELCGSAARELRKDCFRGVGSTIVGFLGKAKLRLGCGALSGRAFEAAACVRGGRQYVQLVAAER